jgi:hypothetical protein
LGLENEDRTLELCDQMVQGMPVFDAMGPAERQAMVEVLVGLMSHCRFVLLLIHSIPYSLIYSVPLFLKRQCDRTLGAGAGHPQRWHPHHPAGRP